MRNYSNMAESVPASFRQYLLPMPSVKQSNRSSLQIRAQGFRDEGKSGIDAKMSILMERIKGVKVKERLERCCRSENGWNYAAGYNSKHHMDTSKFLEIFGIIFGTFGLTIATGTLFLYLFSLWLHSCR